MMRKKMLIIVAATLCTAALTAGCGSGRDGTLNSMQTESSSSSTKVKTTDKPTATSKAMTDKSTATSKTKATTKPKTTTKPTATPKAASNLPKPMDEVFSYISVDKDDLYDDNQNPYIKYKGCENTAEVLETIEKYIDYLKDYGYTQSGYKKSASSYYTYYLESSDSSLATLTKRDVECQLAIEGWANDKYDWKAIEVYYSPDIVEEYRDVDGGSNGGGGGSGGSIDIGNDDDDDDRKCINCNGTGSVTCKTCNGKGRVSQIVTVPKYTSGVGGTKNVTKTCDNCNGTGKKSCSACGGDGIR